MIPGGVALFFYWPKLKPIYLLFLKIHPHMTPPPRGRPTHPPKNPPPKMGENPLNKKQLSTGLAANVARALDSIMCILQRFRKVAEVTGE